ncbi:MAG: type IV toxin-antitoxin system AbiEi family antitoxin domain-containing protein [Solirubrobacterales bacterium]|nr:type IV toxin-antitoxin system AbiEi family antitoxin domain-containing protein [Solirubrobacterales bacterium]
MPNRSAKVARIASRQWGLITWAQLAGLGTARSTVAEWSREGYLHRIHPRVYAVGHAAGGRETELAAALLYAGPGAMLSHATALWWHGLLDKLPRPLQVTTPRRCQSLSGVRVYGRRTHERILHKGLPTTTVEQAVLDFAATAPLERVRHVLANADYHQVLDVAALQVIAGNGRAGSPKLKMALKRHEPKLARTRSPLERLFLPLCEKYGVPLPDDVNVLVAGILVDAVWWRQKLVVELDGRNNHSSWAQIQRDRSNEMRLRAAGFDTLRYGTAQVQEQPELVAGDVIRRLSSPAESA